MMINQNAFAITLSTLAISVLTCLMSSTIIIRIIHHVIYNRIKQEDRMILIHSIHIYILLFIETILIFSLAIQTVLGDMYEKDFNSSWCIFQGYFSLVILGTLYWAFINQAFFRLCRIVYSAYRWLQFYWLYIIIPFIELVLLSIYLMPLLIWNTIIYLPKEYYCFVPMTNLRGVLWFICSVYGISFLLLALIYLRIIIYLHRQSHNQRYIIKQRQKRDLIVIRRIFISFSLLVILGSPGALLLVMLYITGEEHPLLYRIEWFFVNLSMLGLSLSQLILTPQLKSIVSRMFQHNRVAPHNGILERSIAMQHLN